MMPGVSAGPFDYLDRFSSQSEFEDAAIRMSAVINQD
jgi:hypothetical protein